MNPKSAGSTPVRSVWVGVADPIIVPWDHSGVNPVRSAFEGISRHAQCFANLFWLYVASERGAAASTGSPFFALMQLKKMISNGLRYGQSDFGAPDCKVALSWL